MNNINKENGNGEFRQILDKLENIEAILTKLTSRKESLKSDELLDNGDICALLGITKRTLQRYRQKGVLPYYMMKGKPYYKPDEVQECLKRILKNNSEINLK